MSNQGQVGNFIEKVDQVAPGVTPPPTKPDGTPEPKVAFRSAYVLTNEQEDNLVNYALLRLDQLEDELGRKTTSMQNWQTAENSKQSASTFLGKRELYEAIFHNEVAWRASVLGGIFAKSNLIVPLARRYVRQMFARANNYFFSTDPWFSGYPEGNEDEALADKVDRYSKFKIERSNCKNVLEEAVQLAFIRGEVVVKTAHVVKEDFYARNENVLVDAEGKDILPPDGDYITDQDEWVPATQLQEVPDPSTGELVQQEVQVGGEVLKRDGAFPKPEVPLFMEKTVTRKITLFRGPETGIVFFKDFLCPLAASSVDDADCICHLYDMPIMNMVDQTQRKSMEGATDAKSFEEMKRAIELVRNLANESSEPKSERNQPRTEGGEQKTSTATDNPIGNFAEFYLKYDANGDGIMEEIMLVVDRTRRLPIFYDYLANVTRDDKRPYKVIRINKLDGRWYGLGAMEMFNPSQEICDLLINRINFAQGGAGRVTFWDPSKTMEGQSNKHLRLNDGGTYTPVNGAKADEILQYVVLPEIKGEMLFKLLEFFMQLVQLESGVIHAGDQTFSGMDSAKLATGIRNIEKSGEEMFASYLSQLEPGIQAVLDANFTEIFGNLDQEEVFEYFEGDTRLLDTIKPDDVRNLRFHTKLLLTRYRSEQILQSYMQGSMLVTQFYSYPFEIQQRVAPLYIGMLKALQVPNAERAIEPSQVPLTPPGQPMNPAAAAKAVPKGPPGQSPPLI